MAAIYGGGATCAGSSDMDQCRAPPVAVAASRPLPAQCMRPPAAPCHLVVLFVPQTRLMLWCWTWAPGRPRPAMLAMTRPRLCFLRWVWPPGSMFMAGSHQQPCLHARSTVQCMFKCCMLHHPAQVAGVVAGDANGMDVDGEQQQQQPGGSRKLYLGSQDVSFRRQHMEVRLRMPVTTTRHHNTVQRSAPQHLAVAAPSLPACLPACLPA